MFRKLPILLGLMLVVPFVDTQAVAIGNSMPIENATLLLKEGRLDESIKVLKDVEENNSNNFEFYRLIGSVYLAAGDIDTAIDAIKRAEVLSPNSAATWMLLSTAYNSRLNEAGIFRKFAAARDVRDALEMVIKIDPTHAEALQYLAIFYYSAPKPAGRDAERGATILDRLENVDRARWLHAKARIAKDAGDKSAADGYYVQALNENPIYEEIYLDSASLLESMGRADRALDVLVSGYERAPEARELLYQLARVASIERKSCAIGMAAIRRYLAVPPVYRNHSEAWSLHRRGLLYQCLGDDHSAAIDYSQALRLDNGLADARKALEKIGK